MRVVTRKEGVIRFGLVPIGEGFIHDGNVYIKIADWKGFDVKLNKISEDIPKDKIVTQIELTLTVEEFKC